jgi:hypothetical protein
MWAGWKHDNMKPPAVLAGALSGTLQTGRALDYLHDRGENRILCSLYLSLADRIDARLDHFRDAETHLARFLAAGLNDSPPILQGHEKRRHRVLQT